MAPRNFPRSALLALCAALALGCTPPEYESTADSDTVLTYDATDTAQDEPDAVSGVDTLPDALPDVAIAPDTPADIPPDGPKPGPTCAPAKAADCAKCGNPPTDYPLCNDCPYYNPPPECYAVCSAGQCYSCGTFPQGKAVWGIVYYDCVKAGGNDAASTPDVSDAVD